MVGNRGEVHLEFRPLGLVIDFQPLHHPCGAAGGGGHQEMVVGQAGGYTVVEDHAVFLAHQAVTGLAHIQLGPGVGVHAVEKLAGIRALNIDLAEGRGVQNADCVTHGQALAGHGGVQVFTGFGEVPRALPLTHVLELGTVLQVPALHRGVTFGLEQRATVTAGHRAEGHRSVVRAEHGGAHLRDADAQRTGGNCQTVDIAQLALISAEAQRGVAFDVLDRLEAFTRSQLDTSGGDVILQVNKLLGRTRRRLVVRHLEQRQGRFFHAHGNLRQAGGNRLETGFGSCRYTRLETIGQSITQAEHAIDRTRAQALLEATLAWHKGQNIFTPGRPAAQVRGQVHHRAVTAGADDQIAVEHFARADDLMALYIDGADARSGNPLAASGFDHGAAGENTHTTAASLFHPATARVAAGIGHRHHLQTGVEPVEHHAVGVIVVGRQHQLLARRHAVAAHISGHRIGEHIARHVVVGVHKRPLVGASGQHHTCGAYAVHTLAHHPHWRDFTEVIGQALVNGEEVMVVVTVDRGTRQQGHFRHARQLGNHLRGPVGGRFAVEGFAGAEQTAAELFLLIGENHPCTAARSRQGCGQTRRAGADYQHVAVLVHVVVAVRVHGGRRAAKTCGLADVFLVGQPEILRVHKGFVVEPRRHHLAADLAENAHQVGVYARPAVGAAGDQAGIQRLLGGAHVGDLRRFSAADLQYSVRLFRARRNDAARPRVLEAAPDDIHAIG